MEFSPKKNESLQWTIHVTYNPLTRRYYIYMDGKRVKVYSGITNPLDAIARFGKSLKPQP